MDLWLPLAVISLPAWTSLLSLGLLAAVLALDDTALAQTWIGQPLPAGILAGYLCGDPLTGLAIGLPLQLVLAGNLPIGQTFTGDPTSATIAAVGGVLLGARPLPPVLAGDAGETWPLLGWIILGAALLSLLGHLLVQAERRANGLWMQQGLHSLRDGRLARIEGLQVICLLGTSLRGFVSGILFVLLMLNVWIPLFGQLPRLLQGALGTLPLLLPGLGVGTMIDRYGVKSSWPWVAAGMVGAFVVARFVA